jgi:UDP-N-acetylmuramate dehydrogenase
MTAAAASRVLLPVRERRDRRLDEKLVRRLREIAAVRLDEPLARHTTFGIGGPADVFVTVRDAGQLAAAVLAARQAEAPVFILGSGSNILVGDRGIRGVTIDNQAKAYRITSGGDPGRFDVTAESGASFAALARTLARQGYGGIEWASGIPGSLGGAVVYNAGAYGGCLADVLVSASILDGNGGTRRYSLADLKLTYRNSIFTRGACTNCVVLDVTFTVTRGEPAALLAEIARIDAERLAAQPRGRTGGSTFKNPGDRHAWELIDGAGLRGYRIGDAQISEKHCNFFMNVGAARAADVYALMELARGRVRERFGIELENEVELVGEGF